MKLSITFKGLKYWLGDAGEVALLYQETGWAVMIARLGIMVACTIWIGTMLLLPAIHAAQVQPHSNGLEVQQAFTQQQVVDNAKDLSRLQSDLDNQRTLISTLRDDLATVKGVGIGAASVIGLLQTLQMILQVRAVKKA